MGTHKNSWSLASVAVGRPVSYIPQLSTYLFIHMIYTSMYIIHKLHLYIDIKIHVHIYIYMYICTYVCMSYIFHPTAQQGRVCIWTSWAAQSVGASEFVLKSGPYC